MPALDRYPRIVNLCWLAVIAAGVSGCATHADRAVTIRQAYFQGNLNQAAESTAVESDSKQHDRDVLRLNQAMVSLTSGDAQQAETILRQVRDQFDHFEEKSLAEQAHSLLTDDRKIAYAGEEYEKILIRVMLAVSDLMQDADDVNAYTLQISDKQQELLRKYQTGENGIQLAQTPEFVSLQKQLAIGSYLRAAVLETSPLDYDDVARCRLQVVNWQPDFRDASIDLARAEQGRHSQPGHGVVYVIGFVGAGPLKKEVPAPVTTASLLIADRILSATGKHELPPNIAPVKIPEVVRPAQTVENIQVYREQKLLGSTATIMDVSELAVEQNRLERDDVIARAVVRRIIKKGAIYTAKEVAQTQRSGAADILLTVAGIAWEATERADTRCWSLLPDRIQVMRIELPAGQQQLTMIPQLKNGRGESQTVNVDIQDGKSTFILTNCPDRHWIGPPLVAQPR